MENLKKKTFFTIFIIISLFAVFFATFFNVQTYHREYVGIMNNLTRMKNLMQKRPESLDKEKKPINDDLHNRKVMDYEVYTFILNEDNEIIDQISHNDNKISDEIITKAKNIIANNKSKVKIGCLYLESYAYNFENNNSLTIVNISNTRNMLLTNLFISLLLVCIGELLIYLISRKITEWITKPVVMSFDREKEFGAIIADALAFITGVILLMSEFKRIEKTLTK